MGNIVKLGIILMIFCLASAAALSYVNEVTSPIIAKFSAEEELKAKRNLFAGDKLNLLLFPNGEYEYKTDGKTVIKIKFVSHAIDTLSVDKIYYKLDNDEVSELNTLANNFSRDQEIDFSKVPDKFQKVVQDMAKAFLSKLSFTKVIAVLNVFGTNLNVKEQKDGVIVGEYKKSKIYFKKSEEKKGKVELVKVDDSFYKELKNSGKVIFNNGDSVKFDGKKYYDIFAYDKVYMGDNFLGYIIKVAPSGYSSNIETLIALDKKGKIIGLKILSQQETPGLGAKCQEPWFQKQFKGLTVNELYLKKKDKRGKIDAITAATITSNAVTTGVREGIEKFLKMVGGEK